MKIGIHFGTDTGRTRRIAKLIAQKPDALTLRGHRHR